MTLLDKNDNPPDLSVTQTTIQRDETTTINVSYFLFEASDVDTNKTLYFEIISGNTGSRFTLAAAQLADLRYTISVENAEIIDFNDEEEYNLTIRVTDSGVPPLYTDLNLIIELQDIINKPPVFNESLFTGTVVEHSPAGVSVTQLFAFDADTADSGDALVYRYLALMDHGQL